MGAAVYRPKTSGSQPGPYVAIQWAIGQRAGAKKWRGRQGGDRVITGNIDASVRLICEDSVRPE